MMKIETTNDRKIKGYSIIAKGDVPESIGGNTFLVPSQSMTKKYRVIGGQYKWTCECKDFEKKHLDCKHICSVKIWLALKQKIELKQDFGTEIKENNEIKCAHCGSVKFVRNGKRKNFSNNKQTYKCKDCKRYFVEEPFKKLKGTPQMVTLIMDLYFKGISLRKIQDHLEQIYGVRITHVTIYNYISKFTKLIDKYIIRFHPKASEMWHADEMMVSLNGESKWLWNCMDRDTRFMLSNHITSARETKDAEHLFAEAKGRAQSKPLFLVTDGLPSYRKAFGRELYSKKEQSVHVSGNSFKDKVNNNIMERANGTIRERVKVSRGLKNGNMLRGQKMYYNFIRPHQALNGLTPAQKAKIELKLASNKWLSLIRQSSGGVQNGF